MSSVLIHNCALRVVRHGGWSWGPDVERLLQAALRGLPDLIGRRLAAIWTDGMDVEINRTVRIDVPVRVMELIALGAKFVELPDVPGGAAATLEARIDQAVKASFAPDRAPADSVVAPSALPSGPAALASAEPHPGFAQQLSQNAMANLLASWSHGDGLAARLLLFSESSLETWYASLASKAHGLSRATPPASGSTASIDTSVRSVRDSLGIPASASADRAALLSARLVLAAVASGKLSLPPDDPSLIQSVERAVAFSSAEQSVQPAAITSPAAVANPAPAAASTSAPPATASLKAEMENTRHVSSALPFLLLSVLSRTGYLETVSASLDALGLNSLLPAFAAALAFKVLDPPERGWRRTPRSIITASVFAGIQGEIDEASLVHCSRLLEGSLSPLNALLAESLMRGHAADQPLVLSPAAHGLLLTDGEGVLPIAWAAQFSDLLPVLKQAPTAVLLTPIEVANPETLRQAHASGLSFLTNAPPVRGEQWRVLTAPGAVRYWTNDTASQASTLIVFAGRLQPMVQQSQTWWNELAARPGVPLAPDADFERTLALGAGVALGMIAWLLWRGREATSPLLALQRFADLDARVRFTKDTVQVRLPLGKRQQDLKASGLLKSVNDAPWYGGRTIEFAEG